MPHWLAHFLGLDSASGTPYLAWSGIVGDATIIGALLASPAVYARHHNCLRKGCWRLGHVRQIEGRSIVLCHRHEHEAAGG